MMGKTHAATGVLTGLLIGRGIGLDTISELGPFSTMSAGYALGPDLDHPKASATLLLGWLTRGVSWLLRRASAGVYALTKVPGGKERAGTHRHLSHTFLFAGLLGGVCAISTSYGGPWVVAGWLLFGLLLAADRLGMIALVGFGVAGASLLPNAAADEAILNMLTQSQGWLGIAVALGCATHCLGDALTESGCPFLFPIPIAGDPWYELRPPAFLRFRTGKAFETWVVFPAVMVGCAAAVPGLTESLWELLDAAQPIAGGTR